MEQVKGPITNEVLRQAAEQEHPKHKAIGREITLLWERVNMLAEALEARTQKAESQVFRAREVAAVRHAKLAQQVESLDTFTDELNDRFDNAVENAEDYRGALRTIVTALANGAIENAERLDELDPDGNKGAVVRTAKHNDLKKRVRFLESLMATPDTDEPLEPLPTRSLWDTIKGWG